MLALFLFVSSLPLPTAVSAIFNRRRCCYWKPLLTLSLQRSSGFRDAEAFAKEVGEIVLLRGRRWRCSFRPDGLRACRATA